MGKNMKQKAIHIFIIFAFVGLYVLVATTSMINSVAFFELANNKTMSWVLAIGFELGAAASLGAILILERTNKIMVWGLFVVLTLFQMMANSFHAYVNLNNYTPWIELFGLSEEEPITQKRILSIVSGALLPIIALGFIKSLTDYMKPQYEEEYIDEEIVDEEIVDELIVEGEIIDELIVEEEIVDEPIVGGEIIDELIVEEEIVDELIVGEEIIIEEIVNEPIVEGETIDVEDLIIVEETQIPILDIVEPIVESEIVNEPILDIKEDDDDLAMLAAVEEINREEGFVNMIEPEISHKKVDVQLQADIVSANARDPQKPKQKKGETISKGLPLKIITK